VPGAEEYVEILLDFLERLPPAVVVQRLTGDPMPAELVAPPWVREKAKTLNSHRQAVRGERFMAREVIEH